MILMVTVILLFDYRGGFDTASDAQSSPSGRPARSARPQKYGNLMRKRRRIEIVGNKFIDGALQDNGCGNCVFPSHILAPLRQELPQSGRTLKNFLLLFKGFVVMTS